MISGHLIVLNHTYNKLTISTSNCRYQLDYVQNWFHARYRCILAMLYYKRVCQSCYSDDPFKLHSQQSQHHYGQVERVLRNIIPSFTWFLCPVVDSPQWHWCSSQYPANLCEFKSDTLVIYRPKDYLTDTGTNERPELSHHHFWLETTYTDICDQR